MCSVKQAGSTAAEVTLVASSYHLQHGSFSSLSLKHLLYKRVCNLGPNEQWVAGLGVISLMKVVQAGRGAGHHHYNNFTSAISSTATAAFVLSCCKVLAAAAAALQHMSCNNVFGSSSSSSSSSYWACESLC
jgi:hypothetical protein